MISSESFRKCANYFKRDERWHVLELACGDGTSSESFMRALLKMNIRLDEIALNDFIPEKVD
jgi:hypothetical protein